MSLQITTQLGYISLYTNELSAPFSGFTQGLSSLYLGGAPGDTLGDTVYDGGVKACVAQLSRSFGGNMWDFVALQGQAMQGKGVRECTLEEFA